MLSVTFVSNYINHHQLPFCRAMDNSPEVTFHFIQTMPMEQKRIEMGWGVDPKEYSFVELYYEKEEECKKLILESDVTILGWSEGLIADVEEKRLSSGKLSFRMSERIYREGQWKFLSPRGLMSKYHEHIRFRKYPVFLLCTGAYVASDFSLIHSYPDKKLKWGYFPGASRNAVTKDSGKDLSQGTGEEKNSSGSGKIKLCWAGRLIELKHPEFAIEAAHVLKTKGYDFSLEIIGDGPLRESLDKLVADYGLFDEVRLLGNLKPSAVLDKMDEADVFLFTSNYLEGWGAVVNEAMQSGCAVVASYEAGAVPFLIEDGVNGICYKNGDAGEFISKVTYLFENSDLIPKIGERGRRTIADKWNAQNAAAEFVRFCREYLENGAVVPAENGPMSIADVYRPAGFVRTLQEKNRLE